MVRTLKLNFLLAMFYMLNVSAAEPKAGQDKRIKVELDGESSIIETYKTPGNTSGHGNYMGMDLTVGGRTGNRRKNKGNKSGIIEEAYIEKDLEVIKRELGSLR